MKWPVSGRARAIFATVLLVAFAACDDDPPPESRVTAVTPAAGNMQEGVVGQALPQLIVLQAVDAAGSPVRGARVVWEVVSGGGSIGATSTTTTDAEGRAAATWTLGTTSGAQSARAQVGTAVVQFTATGLPAAAATVAVTPEQVMLDAIGSTADLSIVARDQFGNLIEGRAPTWASSNNSIATVNTTGRVTATGRGSTTVRATLEGVTDEAGVTVEPVAASIQVTPSSPTLGSIGATVQLQASARDRNGNPVQVPAGEFEWASSNTAIITVSATGVATAVAVGTAQAEASLGNVIGSASVTVAPVATSLVVSPRTDTLTTAEPTRQLTVVARDGNGNVIPSPTVTWTSNNTGIARVSATGVVTAVANGVAKIAGRSGTASDTSTITVLLNAGPLARPDSIGVVENTTRNLSSPGLLANDSLGRPAATIVSFGGGSLPGSVTANDAGDTVTFGTGGSIRINANGSLVFTPSTDFTGSFNTRYRVSNAAGTSDATVYFEVGEPADAVDDSYQTNQNVQLNVGSPGVLTNDELGFPAATLVSFGGGSVGGSVTSFAAGAQVAFGIGGFIRVNANGSFSFRPPTNGTGNYTFNYRLSSSTGTNDATVTVEVIVPPP